MKTLLLIFSLLIFDNATAQREEILNNYIGMNMKSIKYLMTENRGFCIWEEIETGIGFFNCREENQFSLFYFYFFPSKKELCTRYMIKCNAVDKEKLIKYLSSTGKFRKYSTNTETYRMTINDEIYLGIGRYLGETYHISITKYEEK